MRGHNICFYGKLTEIIFELTSNNYLIWTLVHGNIQNLNNKILQDIYGKFRYGICCCIVVVLLFYVHGKHLRSCRDGQLT